MPKWIAFLALLLSSATLLAQTTETRRVVEASGATLAEKVTAVQNGCTGEVSCYIIFDVGLPEVPGENIGSPCGNCTWIDYRVPQNLKTGTSLPGTCSIGEEFFKTDATAGQNKYGCTEPNTWSLLGDGGGEGGGITVLNTLTATSQAFATPGTTGTAPNWSSLTDIHTLHLPLAATTSVTAGLISKVEYDTFNGKQDALGFTPENSANKGVVSGYAPLNASSEVPATNLPNVSGVGPCTNQVVTATNDLTAPTCANVSSAMIGDGVVVSADLATANKTITKSIDIFSPTTADTNKTQFYWPAAVTLQRIACSVDTGTASINFDERAEATPNTAGTALLAASLQCTTATGVTTTFEDTTHAANVPIVLLITATASSPTVVRIHIRAGIN